MSRRSADGRRVAEKKAPAARPSTPRKRAPKKTAPRQGLALAALSVGLVAIAVAYVGFWLTRPHHGRRGAVRVQLQQASTADAVAATLFREGLIDRPWLFSWILSMTGSVEQVPRRTLLLRDDVSPRALLRAIVSGGGLVRVVIPEGFTRYEIAQRLARDGVVTSEDAFVASTEDPALLQRLQIAGPTAEGYLYPSTYDFALELAPPEVITRMVSTFRRRFDTTRRAHPPTDPRLQRLSLSDRDVVILASMVEEEAGVAEDRAKIASVFLNRMTRADFSHRLLQSDPTVVYGCRAYHPPSCPAAPRTGRIPITRAMLDDSENRYNSYRHEGLVPGPISSPGTAAIEAVLAPATTSALYFVATGGGHSAFADTLAEHNANVQRYLRPRSRP